MGKHLLAQGVLHGDETPVKLLQPGLGKTHQAYVWAWRSSDLCTAEKAVVFDFSKSRSGENARRKFFEAHNLNRSEIAKQALDWIGKLYDIEREVKELDEAQRLAIRQAR